MSRSKYFEAAALTTLIMLTGSICADSSRDLSAKIDQISERNVQGTLGGKNRAYLLPNGPFIAAEFLYWRADEDDLAYAVDTHVNSDMTVYKGKDLDLHGEWKPGARVALGYLFDNFDQWDLTLGWTFFHDKAHHSRKSSNFQTHPFIPNWSSILGPRASSAAARWRLNFNTVDLEVGRNYFISKNISLRPHIGARGVSIHQHYKANYNGVWTIESFSQSGVAISGFLQNPTSFRGKLEYNGGGVVTGADLLWHFNKNWGFFGRVAGSLVYGRFEVRETFDGWRPAANSSGSFLTPVDITIKRNFNRVRANLETAAGFQWETGLYKDKYHLAFRACYELSEWFQQNELFELVLARDSRVLGFASMTDLFSADDDIDLVPSHGDLGFQGLTLRAEFHF